MTEPTENFLGLGNGTLEWVEKPLSISEKFRLVEIAHETNNSQIREAALKVLLHALHPPMVFKGDQIV